MTGIPLCARFSLPTNRLGFCGTPEAGKWLRRAIAEGTEIERAGRALRSFEALYPYLEVLGAATGLDPFDARVVEAYWIGNDLLDRDWRESFRDLLERLTSRGLPRSVAAQLAESLPAGAIPHHTFHVLFVGVGAVTGHVQTTLPNMERCRVSWGTIQHVDGKNVVLEGPALRWDGRAFAVGARRTLSVVHEPDLLEKAKEGDTLASHWDYAVDRLDPDRLAALEKYTLRSIEAANEVARTFPANLGS
ncbi:MAG: DUF6390 family protein [Vicinamibacteria bacterium]